MANEPGRPGLRRRTRDLQGPFKKPKGGQLTEDQQAFNAVHGALRCLGERANSLLKTTYKVPRRYRGCPGESARSPPPRSSCSTPNTSAPHDQNL
jgi:hypothetical protein